jgi:hypothetical protein
VFSSLTLRVTKNACMSDSQISTVLVPNEERRELGWDKRATLDLSMVCKNFQTSRAPAEQEKICRALQVFAGQQLARNPGRMQHLFGTVCALALSHRTAPTAER